MNFALEQSQVMLEHSFLSLSSTRMATGCYEMLPKP